MTGLGKEYGEALYELAREESLRPQIEEELTQIRAIVRGQPDFTRLLVSRAIERDRRLDVVGQVFDGRVHPYVVNFMKLLVQKEHFDAFEDCCQWFHRRYNEDYGIVEAHVWSAVALSESELSALREKLERISGRKVALEASVDPLLIGGLRVEMDGRRYDNTIQDRLGRLRRSLTAGLQERGRTDAAET